MGSTSGWQGTKIERIEVSPIGQITVLQSVGIWSCSQAHAVHANEQVKPAKDIAKLIKERANRPAGS